MTGSPVFSSGDTNASVAPSGESAIWLMLIPSDPANENCMRAQGSEGRAKNHVTAATATIANPTPVHCNHRIRAGAAAFTARAAALVSLPDSALNAKERSRAD